MARVRSELRGSGRFGGHGSLYDTGYQYRTPEREPVVFGPFKRVWPLGERQVPKDTLQTLKDGIIRDGVVYPIWHRSSRTVLNRTILGVDEFGLIPTAFRAEFFRDNANANLLSVEYDDGTTSGVDVSAITSNGTPVAMAPWQKYIYFGNTSITEIRRYSPVDHAFTTVAGSPNPQHLFFLDNNLVAVFKSGNSWVAQWSADSLPENWSGAGSGLEVISGTIGEIKGVGVLSDAAVLIGTQGAVIMSPTGGASPAFKFTRAESIRGTPYNAVVGVSGQVFFVDYKRRLVSFDLTRVTDVGEGMPYISSEPVIYASNRLDLLVVSIPDTDKSYLLNITTNEWVSQLDDSYEFMSDSPFTHNAGRFLCYNDDGLNTELTTLDLDPANYTQPQLETGRYDLFTEVWVDYVDVMRTSITSPIPVLRLLRQLRDGTIQISSFSASTQEGISERGTSVRYYINAPAQFIEAQFGVLELEGAFLLTEFDVNGNFLVDVSNPSGYSRAEDDVNGNFSVSSTALTYVGVGEDADGNFLLGTADLVRDDVWLRDSGVESIKVVLTKQSNEPSAIG